MNGVTNICMSLSTGVLTAFGGTALAQSPSPHLSTSQVYMKAHAKGLQELFAEEEAAAQLEELALLDPDWDGYGALPISETTLANSRRLLQAMLAAPGAVAPDVVPNPNGTVSFEWESDYGFAALEVGANRISFYGKSGAGASVHVDGSAVSIANVEAAQMALYAAYATRPGESRSSVTNVHTLADV